jgi:hypothetical protein
MQERRRSFRGRVYYGGRLAFHDRKSTIDCVVRNFSGSGARIELESLVTVPDQVDLTIPRKGMAFLGRIIWRREKQAGLALHHPKHLRAEMPLDVALRMRATERAKQRLRQQLDLLRSEH